MYRTIRQFGSPLTLKRTRIYPLIISNQRTAWTLTFVKTMAVFSTVCHVLLYTAIFAFVYQIPSIFPALRLQCIKLKHGLFAPPCQGIGCVVKTDWYIILIGRELTCSRKLMLEIEVSGAFLGHLIEFLL